ncbi:HD domain-containing protein [Endozoicomonas sp.]|uniref:HD domain-containing protein n=1 Tax=Endozoicomonas sp. TaxID=1892382 RepID=UPI00383B314E
MSILKKVNLRCWLVLSVLFSCQIVAAADNQAPPKPIETFYGVINPDGMESDQFALVSALLHSPAVNRLKQINQYGPIQMVDSAGHNNEPYTRYDHSLGVFYLLHHYGAPVDEQISGLLHDLPHTAFSHVSDYLFSTDSAGDPNYHDSKFISFLKKHDVARILENHQLSPEAVDPKNNKHFTRLERALPDLAADRLDYTLQGAARRQYLSRQQVEAILEDLFFDPSSGHWYSRTLTSARLIGNASMELNRNIFVTAWGRVLYLWAAEALRQLTAAQELSPDDIFFNMGDQQIWQKIHQSSLPEVQQLNQKMKSVWFTVREADSPGPDTITFAKVRCRIVDPRVVTASDETSSGIIWQRVSDLDPDFKTRYQAELKRCQLFYANISP